jgi:hypothetical protein
MDHSEALQLMATEKYLLNEFPPEMRDEFEEHFFGCQECALDLRMTAAFLEHSKKELSTPETVLERADPSKAGWLARLRPAFVFPSFAILLIVIGYQAFVVHPSLSSAIADLKKPRILASAYLSSGTARGDSKAVITDQNGQPFVLFVDIPTDKRFSSYSAELLSPLGTKVWSLTIPAETVESAKDALPIQVAPANNESGKYVLVVRGIADGAAEGPEVARYEFDLQLH